MSEKIYAERDIIGMDSKGGHYCRHISAMTGEGLHSKSDIAAELGFRDMIIADLEAKCAALAAENAALNEKMDKFATWPGIEFYSSAWEFNSGDGDDALEFLCDSETPSTDAFLAEVRAQGVEMVIAHHRERADALHHVDRNNAIRHSMAALDASDVAAQLRQDANTAELLAAGIITKVGE